MIMDESENRNKKRESTAAAGWELAYCALFLILVALFAMLVSYSSIEDEKVMNFMRGFGGDAMRSMRESVIVEISGYMPTEGDRIRMPSKEMASLDSETVMLAYERLAQAAQRSPEVASAVGIEKTERGFKAVLKGDVLFASGTAEITPEFYPYLDELAEILKDSNFMVRVEGHTDNVPINTARFPSNWELSTARAVSVIRYFLDKAAVDAERLEAVGFGEYRPAAPNDTVEGRAKNRRVECYFEPLTAG